MVQSVETKTIVRFWKKYQALTAKFDGHERGGQKTEATMEDMIQDLHINDVAKQKIVEVQQLRAQHGQWGRAPLRLSHDGEHPAWVARDLRRRAKRRRSQQQLGSSR